MENQNNQLLEVDRSSLYQKNIGAEFTYLYMPSLC